MQDFDILQDFCREMRDYLQSVGHDLAELEQPSVPGAVWNRLFRTFHQIWSICQFLGFAELAQRAEQSKNCIRLAREDESASPQRAELVAELRKARAAMEAKLARVGPTSLYG